MSHPLQRLSRAALIGLVDALASGRLRAPYTRTMLAPFAPAADCEHVAQALSQMDGEGMAPRHIARAIAMVVAERTGAEGLSDRIELVWSPPELDQVDARDTAVVVQDLFRAARASVLIASYALDKGKKAQAVFGVLAQRMDDVPELRVRLFVNIHRKHLDEAPAARLVREFAQSFRQEIWPGERLPEVYYDPRSVEVEGAQRAALHAKCVVVDGRYTLLSSANFTEAAQERNIEAGLLVDDVRLAERVTRQFEGLVARRQLQMVPGL